jgi:hypothetical protein
MHWSVKAEYLFLGVQRNIQSCAPAGGFAPAASFDCTTTHTVQTKRDGLDSRRIGGCVGTG